MSSYPAPASAQYPQVNDVPKQQSITDKAHNLMVLAQQVESLAFSCDRKVTPPAPSTSGVGIPAPEPDHMVFMLEAAETALRNASQVLDALAARL